MVESGQLPAWKTRGGHRRIPLEAAQALGRGKRKPARAGSLAVLVVEDNPAMVALYEKTFSRRPYPVTLHVAADAAEALLLIERIRPALVITDLVMEPFDGFHLMKVLQRSPELARLKVLAVSALSPAAISERGGLPPGVIVYRKPLVQERFEGFLDGFFQAVTPGPATV
jgi:CheY-like chemotaxis protein